MSLQVTSEEVYLVYLVQRPPCIFNTVKLLRHKWLQMNVAVSYHFRNRTFIKMFDIDISSFS